MLLVCNGSRRKAEVARRCPLKRRPVRRPAHHVPAFLGRRRFLRERAGVSAIREVSPGSHFLGCAHTQANFETAFWRSTIADNNSFEQWRDDGGKDATQRANETWKRMLRDYEAPALDEALQAFMAKRKEGLSDGVA